MTKKKVIAYFTSQYGRAGDTFIRGEVAQLRAMGFIVHTFSVRKPHESETVSPQIEQERASTDYLLGQSITRLVGQGLLFAVKHPGAFARALAIALRIGWLGFRGRLLPIAYLLEASALAHRLLGKKVEHLHNHIGRNSAAVAMLASELSGIPYSLTIHGPTEFDMPGELALSEKIRRSRFTIAISHFGRSQLMRWSDASDWPKIHVVRCAVGEEFKLAEPTDVPDVATFVCVGRLVEQKGHLLLLEAIHQLVKEGIAVRLDIIGDGPFRGMIESSVARWGLGDQIKLLGWKNSEEVRDIIRSSRAMVLPSFAEGLPVVLMEAMALARPVIATAIAGIPELVEPGKNGWLVPPGSIEHLAVALREVLKTPVERLTEMGRAGRECVLARHDAAQEAQKLASLIMGSPSKNSANLSATGTRGEI